jgi:hypothetical protein
LNFYFNLNIPVFLTFKVSVYTVLLLVNLVKGGVLISLDGLHPYQKEREQHFREEM